MEPTVAEKVRDVLRRLAPALSVDGGGVELVRVEGDAAYVRLIGACVGCPGVDITLRYGIESAISEEVPEIARVIPVEEETPQP